MPRDSAVEHGRQCLLRYLGEAHVRTIFNQAEEFFGREVGLLVNAENDRLISRNPTPIHLTEKEVRELALRYGAILRRTGAHLAKLLGKAVGLRRGIAQAESSCIDSAVREFIRGKLSARIASKLFQTAVSRVTVLTNKREARKLLRNLLKNPRADLMDGLMRNAKEEIEYAQALYGRSRQRHRVDHPVTPEPSPAEKVKNPSAYPVMTVKEVRTLTGKSRSTINRWTDIEGKLKRAALGNDLGKRRSFLILTSSVAKLLEESPE